MNRLPTILLAGLLAAPTPVTAADIVAGNVTTALGPDFFFDAAATGGGDNNSNVFTRDITGYWTAGATVTLKGLGWAMSASGTTATSATATFTDAGSDETIGTSDDGSGTLKVTGNLNAGRNESSNDSFLFANGGILHVGGDAIFGRDTGACDGSLIVAGGTVEIGGDLALGAFERGGAMLRFQDPGSSPAVEVGGTLTLGRCALDLTFTNAYVHTPDQVITLVRYASREGQFANFRNGDEFNCGRNRFRIAYDADSDDDTLPDGNEVLTLGTNPNLADTDADGLTDKVENGGGNWVSATEAGTSPLDNDSDNDSLLDGVETNDGTFRLATP